MAPTNRITDVETSLDKPMTSKAIETLLKGVNSQLRSPLNKQSLTVKSGSLSPAEACVLFICGNAASDATKAQYGGAYGMTKAVMENTGDKPLDKAVFDIAGPFDESKFPSLVKFTTNVSKHIVNKTTDFEARETIRATLADAILEAGTSMHASMETETLLKSLGLAKGAGQDVY